MSYRKDNYLLSRSLTASSRLTTQHLLLSRRTSSLLDPRILANPSFTVQRELNIADIGCGNGIWAIEMSRLDTVQIQGLDISSELFPPSNIWPSNCTFATFNVLEPLGDEYIGAFDIINIRLLAPGLGLNDATITLSNLDLMLRKGGWVQWVDIAPPFVLSYESGLYDVARLSITTELPKKVTHSLVWLKELPALLQERGFTQVETYECHPQTSLLKHETDNFILALSEIRHYLISRNYLRTEFEQAFQEVQTYRIDGGLVAIALNATIARK